MQEVIQNADDAGATTVRFFVDCRQHGVDPARLWHRKLAQFQGPALLVYNDARFEGDDWEGIQNLQQSIKAKDPFKVGKFGIGFNSVYHLTGKQYRKLGSKSIFIYTPIRHFHCTKGRGLLF